MSTTDHHIEPIRPGGGLRRLRQGPDRRRIPGPTTNVLTKNQFKTALQTEVDRALRDELTLLVMQVRVRAVPGSPENGLKARSLPDEMLELVLACHENLALVVTSPTGMMIFVPSLRRRADGEELVAKLLQALTPAVVLDGLPHHLAPAVGAAMLDNENRSADLLLDGARLALAECDSSRPAMMFHPYQRVRQERRKDLETDLRAAVLSDEIGAALQPAFDLVTGRLMAVEAFARWEREGKGPVPATEFVQMASDLGVGYLISQQVLNRSLVTLEALGAKDVTLWLNVSPEELFHPEFGQSVAAAVKAHPSIKVGIELSPSPPSNALETHQILKSLVASGARMAIGDFGIGNSNLTVLRQLPFDAVKLDRGLIRQIAGNDEAADLVRFLIELAGLLGFETTGQGIENEAQAKLLAELGCQIGQGYYYEEPSTDCEVLANWFNP